MLIDSLETRTSYVYPDYSAPAVKLHTLKSQSEPTEADFRGNSQRPAADKLLLGRLSGDELTTFFHRKSDSRAAQDELSKFEEIARFFNSEEMFHLAADSPVIEKHLANQLKNIQENPTMLCLINKLLDVKVEPEIQKVAKKSNERNFVMDYAARGVNGVVDLIARGIETADEAQKRVKERVHTVVQDTGDKTKLAVGAGVVGAVALDKTNTVEISGGLDRASTVVIDPVVEPINTEMSPVRECKAPIDSAFCLVKAIYLAIESKEKTADLTKQVSHLKKQQQISLAKKEKLLISCSLLLKRPMTEKSRIIGVSEAIAKCEYILMLLKKTTLSSEDITSFIEFQKFYSACPVGYGWKSVPNMHEISTNLLKCMGLNGDMITNEILIGLKEGVLQNNEPNIKKYLDLLRRTFFQTVVKNVGYSSSLTSGATKAVLAGLSFGVGGVIFGTLLTCDSTRRLYHNFEKINLFNEKIKVLDKRIDALEHPLSKVDQIVKYSLIARKGNIQKNLKMIERWTGLKNGANIFAGMGGSVAGGITAAQTFGLLAASATLGTVVMATGVGAVVVGVIGTGVGLKISYHQAKTRAAEKSYKVARQNFREAVRSEKKNINSVVSQVKAEGNLRALYENDTSIKVKRQASKNLRGLLEEQELALLNKNFQLRTKQASNINIGINSLTDSQELLELITAFNPSFKEDIKRNIEELRNEASKTVQSYILSPVDKNSDLQ